jgi:hypothetical protein
MVGSHIVMNMVWFAQKKLLCLIVMAYTAMSVLGTFSFAVLEPYHAVKSEIENNRTQDKIFGSVETFFTQHPAEEPVILAKLGSARFSPLRVAFLSGSSISGKPYSKSSSIIAGMQIQYSDLKNNILLKLRI